MNFYRVRSQDHNRDELDLATRSAPLAPKTLDKESRAIDVTMATETPVDIYTYEYGRVQEVLLMSGVVFDKRVPLCDTHDRYNSRSVLGSVSEIRVEGIELAGRAFFSAVESDIFTKVEEGHLTDFSVGYVPERSTYIPEKQTAVIQGREFKGPLLVTEKWRVKELSVCPIGADKKAKARSLADQTKHQTKAEDIMDEKTRKMLIKRGLSPDATDDQAWAFFDEITATRSDGGDQVTPPAPQAPQAGASIVDLETARTEASEASRVAERARVKEILETGRKFNMETQAQAAVDGETSVDAFRAQVLETIQAQDDPTDQVRNDFSLQIDGKDKLRAAMADGLMIRCGAEIETPRYGGDVFAGYSLRGIARECLIRNGIRPDSNIVIMVGRAMTTDDFQYALAETANKFLQTGFDTAEETWRQWCSVGRASDFKINRLIGVSEFDDLDEIPEDSEYKYGKLSDAQETFKLGTFGKLIRLSRQAVINDDLGMLNDVPAKMGEAAQRTVGDLPYAVLTANAAMGDGTALFASGHSNLQDYAVMSVAAMDTGFAAMGLQKDIRGLRRLNITPRYYIGPKTTQGEVEQFFTTTDIGGASNQPNLKNIYAGGRLERVYDARLDDNSTEAWYLAGPKGKTIVVIYLNGQDRPYMESRQGWNSDGVELKVRIDAVAKALSWRALQKFNEQDES